MCPSPGAQKDPWEDDWPECSWEDLAAEGERMRREGLIVDVVTTHGTVTIIRHPLLDQ